MYIVVTNNWKCLLIYTSTPLDLIHLLFMKMGPPSEHQLRGPHRLVGIIA
jgi:hypothetical protein